MLKHVARRPASSLGYCSSSTSNLQHPFASSSLSHLWPGSESCHCSPVSCRRDSMNSSESGVEDVTSSPESTKREFYSLPLLRARSASVSHTPNMRMTLPERIPTLSLSSSDESSSPEPPPKSENMAVSPRKGSLDSQTSFIADPSRSRTLPRRDFKEAQRTLKPADSTFSLQSSVRSSSFDSGRPFMSSRSSSTSSLSEEIKIPVKLFLRRLRPDMEYKTLSLSSTTTCRQLIESLLMKFRLRHRDPNLFFITMEITVRVPGDTTPAKRFLMLDDEARPAELQLCRPSGESRFSVGVRRGGLVRVHDSLLMPGSQYKSLLIAYHTTAEELVQLILNCYNNRENPAHYAIHEMCKNPYSDRPLRPTNCPLLVQSNWPRQTRANFAFVLRRNLSYAFSLKTRMSWRRSLDQSSTDTESEIEDHQLPTHQCVTHHPPVRQQSLPAVTILKALPVRNITSGLTNFETTAIKPILQQQFASPPASRSVTLQLPVLPPSKSPALSESSNTSRDSGYLSSPSTPCKAYGYNYHDSTLCERLNRNRANSLISVSTVHKHPLSTKTSTPVVSLSSISFRKECCVRTPLPDKTPFTLGRLPPPSLTTATVPTSGYTKSSGPSSLPLVLQNHLLPSSLRCDTYTSKEPLRMQITSAVSSSPQKPRQKTIITITSCNKTPASTSSQNPDKSEGKPNRTECQNEYPRERTLGPRTKVPSLFAHSPQGLLDQPLFIREENECPPENSPEQTPSAPPPSPALSQPLLLDASSMFANVSLFATCPERDLNAAIDTLNNLIGLDA